MIFFSILQSPDESPEEPLKLSNVFSAAIGDKKRVDFQSFYMDLEEKANPKFSLDDDQNTKNKFNSKFHGDGTLG